MKILLAVREHDGEAGKAGAFGEVGVEKDSGDEVQEVDGEGEIVVAGVGEGLLGKEGIAEGVVDDFAEDCAAGGGAGDDTAAFVDIDDGLLGFGAFPVGDVGALVAAAEEDDGCVGDGVVGGLGVGVFLGDDEGGSGGGAEAGEEGFAFIGFELGGAEEDDVALVALSRPSSRRPRRPMCLCRRCRRPQRR
jgi:hypothetical protein